MAAGSSRLVTSYCLGRTTRLFSVAACVAAPGLVIVCSVSMAAPNHDRLKKLAMEFRRDLHLGRGARFDSLKVARDPAGRLIERPGLPRAYRFDEFGYPVYASP